jgi:RHS repeat-associated protein
MDAARKAVEDIRMSTIGGMAIATTGSGHMCPGPTPAMSLCPPTPPAGPVPMPFAYIARSATATSTSDKLKVGGNPVLTKDSVMDVDPPGNQPSQPTGGDVLTHAVVGKCHVFTGSSKVTAGGKGVACTGDSAYMCMPTGNGMVAQSVGKLVTAAMINAAADPSIYAGNIVAVFDPISVPSGAVLDEDEDLSLMGLIPFRWVRSYSSARNKEKTPLGAGGWTHNFHQWIERDGDGFVLRDADAAFVRFPASTDRRPVFLRRQRLTLVAGDSTHTIYSLSTRLTRTFRRLVPEGRAWLQSIADAFGNTIRLEYEGERLVRMVDTAERVVALEHDAAGRIVRAAVAGSNYEVTYAYDEDGGLARATNALGASDRYEYDARRRLLRKTLPTGTSFHYRYDDETGRCVRTWGDGGLYAGNLEYDPAEGITRTTGALEPRVFQWDPNEGWVVRESTPDGSYSRGTEYDADGYIVAQTNAGGDTMAFAYDDRGNLVKATDPAGNEATYEYDGDHLVKRTFYGQVTEYTYDHRGALISVKYPSGASVAITWDEHGRIAAVHGPDGLLGGFEYDDRHCVVKEIDPRGAATQMRCDDLGRVVEAIDPLGRRIRRELDLLGRCTTALFPDGSRVERAYDALGRVTREVDRSGCETRYEHAGIKAMTRMTSGGGLLDWRFAFDRDERPQSIKNARGETFEFRWDRGGNMQSVRSFDGRITRYHRTQTHWVGQVENPDDSWQEYTYDPLGFVLTENSPHGAVRFARDEKGRALEIVLEDPTGDVKLAFEYDHLDRTTSATQNGRTIRYEYDTRNRLVSTTLPNGRAIRYAYDEGGQASRIEYGGRSVKITRDVLGREVRRRLEHNGVDVETRWDDLDRPASQQVLSPEGLLVDRRWTYDPRGWVQAVTDARWGTSSYAYDALGRLVGASGASAGATSKTYRYDAGGSLVGMSADETAEPWAMRAGGVLLRSDAYEYEYDLGCRRAKKRSVASPNADSTVYMWDCRGRLREVLLPSGERLLLTYDAFARRVRKEVFPAPPRLEPGGPTPELPPSRVVEYLWDGPNLVAEYDSQGTDRYFIAEPRNGFPLFHEEDGEIYTVIDDHVGVPKEMLDGRGRVAWSAKHSPWGTVLEEAPAPSAARPSRAPRTPFRLLGQYFDDETGLCYTHFRYFDPQVASWISPDPLGLPGGPNLTAFNGSPTSQVDPMGLRCIIIGNPAIDRYLANCMNNPRTPGAYQVYVHGSPNSVGVKNPDGSWTNMTPQQLSDMIRGSYNYQGEGVHLYSCATGQTSNGVGQQVSQNLGTTVYAPNDLIWMHQNGQVAGIFPPATPPPGASAQQLASSGGPDYSRPGQWNVFNNGAPGTGNVYRP